MNKGRYFSLNIRASRFREGITLFDYTDLPAYFGGTQPIMSPQYPVSVMITATEVKFLLHYCVYKFKKGEKTTFSYQLVPYPRGNEQHEIKPDLRHIEEVILELPLDKENPEALASIIKRIYNTVFPITREEHSNYVVECLRKRYESAGDDSIIKSEKEIFEYYRNQDKNRYNVSYSSLKIWGLKNEEGNFELKQKKGDAGLKNTVEGNRTGIIYDKFLRKLLLDFMFDLVHSDVFQNAAQYSQMYSSLKADFFFSTILCKSEYYYYRTLVNQKLEESRSNENILKDNTYQLYSKYFDKAEKKWLECIQSPWATRHFDFVPDWHEALNEKLPARFRRELKNIIRAIGESDTFTIRESWFIEPEAELHRVLFNLKAKEKPINGSESRQDLISNSKHLATLRHNFNQQKLIIRNIETSKWLFKRYNFSEAMRLHFFRYSNLCLVLFLSAFIFIVLGCPSLLLQETWMKLEPYIKYTLPCIFFIFGGERFLNYYLKSKHESHRVSWKVARINSQHFLFKSLILVISLLLLYLAVFIVKQGAVRVSLVIAAIVLLIGIISRYIHIVFPRLISSIAAAWLTITLSEDLYKAFFDASWKIIPSLLISLIVYVFILYEINKISPHADWKKRFGRAFELMLVSYAISLFTGFWFINFTGEKFLERSNYLPEYFREYILTECDRRDKLDIEWDSLHPEMLMNKYTVKINGSDAPIGMYAFAYSDDKTEYLDKISAARTASCHRDSLRKLLYLPETEFLNQRDTTCTDSLYLYSQLNSLRQETLKKIKNRFIAKHENSKMFVDILPYVYHCNKNKGKYYISSVWEFNKEEIEPYKFFILRDFLIQFSFIAMFIGIFIQLIFEEKNITES